MSGFPDPALRLLARRKLGGAMRRQLARMRTLRGALVGLLGFGMLALWVASLVVSALVSDGPRMDPAAARALMRAAGLLFLGLSLFGALNHRGLYLPGDEVERLLAAPVSRADVVRYRLLAGVGRSVFGAVFLGLVLMSHLPVPGFAFLGLVSATAASVLLGQAAALVSGLLERRFVTRFLRLPGTLFFLFALLGGLVIVWLVAFDGAAGRSLGSLDGFAGGRLPSREELAARFDHGWLRLAALPVEPWVRAITASSWGEFAAWFPATLVLLAALYETTARLPLDFRELALETSASVAERLRRLRRVGAGASASAVSRHTRGLRLPFLFGRGPGGALAWRKATEIVRKARGTLWVGLLVMLLLLVFTSFLGRTGAVAPLYQALLVAGLGTVYLCSGLRFDFRDDLDRMAAVKSWPLSPVRAFVATLLPETLLVSGLLAVTVVVRLALSGAFPAEAWAVLLALPLVVFAWVALDNAVFLVAPVRFVPGQDGALHNAGRLAVLVAVRALLAGLASGAVVVTGFGLFTLATEGLGWGTGAARLAAFAGGGAVLLLVDVVLAGLGGWAFDRFDVARDRG